MSQTITTTPAPLGKKLGAWLYDFLICIAIWLAFDLFSTLIAANILGKEAFVENPNILIDSVFYKYTPISLVFLYIVGLQVKSGQTVGMSAWKLMLVKDNGKAVTTKEALPRAIISILGLGMFFGLFNKKKLGWHDMATGTRVVVLPEKKK